MLIEVMTCHRVGCLTFITRYWQSSNRKTRSWQHTIPRSFSVVDICVCSALRGWSLTSVQSVKIRSLICDRKRL